MGLHVIVKQTDAGRVRLRGVFNDEQFQALPLVRSFGAFPSGYHASHFGENEFFSAAMALPESPVDAVVELGCLERWAQRAKYVLAGPGGDKQFFSNAQLADQRAREIVSRWRSGWSGQRGRHTAVQILGMPPHPQDVEAGKTLVDWTLKHNNQAVHSVTVKRIDSRGALEYAKQFNQREVS